MLRGKKITEVGIDVFFFFNFLVLDSAERLPVGKMENAGAHVPTPCPQPCRCLRIACTSTSPLFIASCFVLEL